MSNDYLNSMAIVLDAEGTITDIKKQPYETIEFKVGTHLLNYLDASSVHRFMDYLKNTLDEGYSFGGDLLFHQEGQYVRSPIAMLKSNDALFMMSLNESEHTLRVLNEVVRINNQQTNLIRKAHTLSKNVGEDTMNIYMQELSMLNSELVNTQRLLEQKNTELKRLNDKLKDLTNTDFLTNIPNRRKFFEDIVLCTDHQTCALVMIDFNHFKLVNDEHGHDYGDQVLKAFSVMLSDIAKANDGGCYRLGGDEFAMLIPDQAFEFTRHCDDINSMLKTKHPKVSIAYGIGTLTQKDVKDEKTIMTIMAEVDRLMYTHKKAIKSKVEHSE